MNKVKYPLASSTWDEKELDAIKRVTNSGIFTAGEYVKQFEFEFAKYMGSKYAIMVNSGSSANLIMIAALFYTKKPKLKKGDEVIVPAVSWSTTYAPLHQYGLKLRFVDIDINTLNIDLDMLSKAITDRTKLIFLVNLLGNPNDFNRIEEILKGKDIFYIEDNCESLGATYYGKLAGSFGLMGSHSSFFSHHINTMEGGIVVTDDEELYHIMLSLRAHGWTRNLPRENHLTGRKSNNNFDEEWNFILPGYNLRPLEIEAGIGLEQLKKLPSLINGRRKNANRFIELMEGNQNILLQKEVGKSSWFGFSLIFKETYHKKRKVLIEEFNKNGVEVRPIVAGNITKNPVLKYYDYEIHDKIENAEYLHNQGFFIGNHHYDLTDNIEYLHGVLSEI